MNSPDQPTGWWMYSPEEVFRQLNTRPSGLADPEVMVLRERFGLNKIKSNGRSSAFTVFLNQFKNPVTLILLAASILSYFLQDPTDAVIIIIIVILSSLLGFWQERSAGNAIAELLAMVQIRATALRNAVPVELFIEAIVPGDIVILSAGDMIPADCLVIEVNELFVDEAAFTGETFPVEKRAEILPANTALAQRSNSLFMGSHVISGTAKAVVTATGLRTEFGHIAESLANHKVETEFERGIKHFGFLLMQITLVLVIVIFGINVFLHKPVLDSFLFAMAIAVGLTPQLLPAIITVNLAQGARKMAEKKVIVKKLNSIENFGSMDVLCSDKTGTLTEGKVKVYQGTDLAGQENKRVLELARINALLQQGFRNPIDEAIVATGDSGTGKTPERLDEIPYDFIRKRLTLLVKEDPHPMLITKGACTQVLSVCNTALNEQGQLVPLSAVWEQVHRTYENLSAAGYRTLGVAYKYWEKEGPVHKEDEQEMVFAGFVSLFDPPKKGISDTIHELTALGIHLKVITGDNALVAKSVSKQIGMKDAVILSGQELRQMSDAALRYRVLKTDVFAEVEPNQKERIILALKRAHKVVGYMGDGINDASALHAADVGISVDTAVDVAKEAADIVLLNQDLEVLIGGVKEGRRTFANTQKYIFMATSANFGNMFSMAGASLFLPFLPLLPKQILLTNLMTDLPAMSIATDSVDEEWVSKPRRWNILFIKRFMLVFGILSSLFDYLSFAILLWVFQSSEAGFQTGWFIESVVSATLIVLVVRTRKSFFNSQPGKYLFVSTLFIALLALLLPLLPIAGALGFTSLPLKVYLAMLAIVVLYIGVAEWIKRWFYRHHA